MTQPTFTPSDIEALLKDSYIPELAEVDLAKLTEFANLVADKLAEEWLEIPIIPQHEFKP